MCKRIFFLLLLIFPFSNSNGQVSFREGLENTDPIPQDSIILFEDKLETHQAFLDKAIEEKDDLNQLYGNIYLYYDYIQNENYDAPEKYILEAKKIAEISGNPGWKGWVNYRAGILYVRTNNVEKAIETYKAAVPLCKSAGDSLCMGESYEQLCIMTGLAGNYEEAQMYFDLALPLLKNYGSPKNLCTAYSNYGSLVSMQGKPNEAIPHFQKSIEYCGQINRYDAQASLMNNLADAYRRMGQYDMAIEAYESGLEFNQKHDFGRVMVSNYMGLYLVHEAKGNYEKASEFLIKRYDLKDSLMGQKVQEKISSLETKFENQKKELELQKTKNQLLSAKSRIRFISMLLTSLTIIGLLIIWYNYRKRLQLNLHLTQNEESLSQLTQTLIRKNAGIKSLENQVASMSNTIESDNIIKNIEENLFDQTILTPDDWSAFKINFNKAHPGYIMHLRKSHALSEAEERLFLLLKLNLTRNEIASMLGVSSETVKKTRSRLRKRLNLAPKESLAKFAETF